MSHKRLSGLFSLLFLTAFTLGASNLGASNLGATNLGATNVDSLPDSTSDGSDIINRYMLATQLETPRVGAMQVDIDASVPKLKQHGKLRVLRKISAVGKVTYRVLGFQGDNTVKNQVIARYLQAEQQSQADSKLALSPANYKFRLKGRKDEGGKAIYVFQVLPKAKRVGLFKGEVWLDARSYLPVLEKGRLVKNPSLFFRKVDFERDFAIEGGNAVPAHVSSTISTRIVGKVNLDIAYSSPTAAESDGMEAEASNPPASF